MLVRTYTTAAIVEKVIESLLGSLGSDAAEVYSTPYQNGRERGFVFSSAFFGKRVFVAECRNSDTIQCVVSANDSMFNEEEYKAARYFRYDEHYKAAKFVLASVLGKNWQKPKKGVA